MTPTPIQQPSKGLVFELSNDGTYYIVTEGLSCTDETIVIPNTIIEIEQEAFNRGALNIIDYAGTFEQWKNIKKGMMFSIAGVADWAMTIICLDTRLDASFDSEHIAGDIIIWTEHSCYYDEETGTFCKICGELMSVETTRFACHVYENGKCIYCGKDSITYTGTKVEWFVEHASDGVNYMETIIQCSDGAIEFDSNLGINYEYSNEWGGVYRKNGIVFGQ